MSTPNNNYFCLACLQRVDQDSLQPTVDTMELELLLVRHLNWQPEDLSEELLPKQLCNTCHQQLINFERFQQQANKCRLHLLSLLTKFEIATFETVYEEMEEPSPPDDGPLQPCNADPFDVPTSVVTEAKQSDALQQSVRKGVKKSFKCTQCGHCFAHTITLDAHIRRVHEGKKRPFQCDRCDKSYSFLGGLYTHIKEMHGTQARSYSCDHPDCDRVYISRVALQKHKRLKHILPSPPERKYVCEQCGSIFNQTSHLTTHRRTKHPTEAEAAANALDSKRHFCDICQKHFHTRYTLKYHTMQQHPDSAKDILDGVEQLKQHECPVCGRRMAKRFMLARHMLSHTVAKIPCEHCERLFARKSDLTAHIRAVHLKLKPFDCNYCPESFASLKTCKHHEYIHTGEKPYICESCGQAFRQQTCLKTHSKIHDKPRK